MLPYLYQLVIGGEGTLENLLGSVCKKCTSYEPSPEGFLFMLCQFCKKKPARVRFCSPQCVKRDYRKRHFPNCLWNNLSYFNKTETGKGYKWEKYATKVLKAKHLEFNHEGADLDWNGKSVDVKSKEIAFRRFKHGKLILSKQLGTWTFPRGKMKKIDYFFCICLIKGRVKKIYLIPGKIFPKYGITVGWKSIYDKYLFITK